MVCREAVWNQCEKRITLSRARLNYGSTVVPCLGGSWGIDGVSQPPGAIGYLATTRQYALGMLRQDIFCKRIHRHPSPALIPPVPLLQQQDTHNARQAQKTTVHPSIVLPANCSKAALRGTHSAKSNNKKSRLFGKDKPHTTIT